MEGSSAGRPGDPLRRTSSTAYPHSVSVATDKGAYPIKTPGGQSRTVEQATASRGVGQRVADYIVSTFVQKPIAFVIMAFEEIAAWARHEKVYTFKAPQGGPTPPSSTTSFQEAGLRKEIDTLHQELRAAEARVDLLQKQLSSQASIPQETPAGSKEDDDHFTANSGSGSEASECYTESEVDIEDTEDDDSEYETEGSDAGDESQREASVSDSNRAATPPAHQTEKPQAARLPRSKSASDLQEMGPPAMTRSVSFSEGWSRTSAVKQAPLRTLAVHATAASSESSEREPRRRPVSPETLSATSGEDAVASVKREFRITQETRQLPLELQEQLPYLQGKLKNAPQLLTQLTNYIGGTPPPNLTTEEAVNELFNAAEAADITDEELRALIDKLFEEFADDLLAAEDELRHTTDVLQAEGTLSTISPQARVLAQNLSHRLEALTIASEAEEEEASEFEDIEIKSAPNKTAAALAATTKPAAAEPKEKSGITRAWNWLSNLFIPSFLRRKEKVEELDTTALPAAENDTAIAADIEALGAANLETLTSEQLSKLQALKDAASVRTKEGDDDRMNVDDEIDASVDESDTDSNDDGDMFDPKDEDGEVELVLPASGIPPTSQPAATEPTGHRRPAPKTRAALQAATAARTAEQQKDLQHTPPATATAAHASEVIQVEHAPTGPVPKAKTFLAGIKPQGAQGQSAIASQRDPAYAVARTQNVITQANKLLQPGSNPNLEEVQSSIRTIEEQIASLAQSGQKSDPALQATYRNLRTLNVRLESLAATPEQPTQEAEPAPATAAPDTEIRTPETSAPEMRTASQLIKSARDLQTNFRTAVDALDVKLQTATDPEQSKLMEARDQLIGKYLADIREVQTAVSDLQEQHRNELPQIQKRTAVHRITIDANREISLNQEAPHLEKLQTALESEVASITASLKPPMDLSPEEMDQLHTGQLLHKIDNFLETLSNPIPEAETRQAQVFQAAAQRRLVELENEQATNPTNQRQEFIQAYKEVVQSLSLEQPTAATPEPAVTEPLPEAKKAPEAPSREGRPSVLPSVRAEQEQRRLSEIAGQSGHPSTEDIQFIQKLQAPNITERQELLNEYHQLDQQKLNLAQNQSNKAQIEEINSRMQNIKQRVLELVREIKSSNTVVTQLLSPIPPDQLTAEEISLLPAKLLMGKATALCQMSLTPEDSKKILEYRNALQERMRSEPPASASRIRDFINYVDYRNETLAIPEQVANVVRTFEQNSLLAFDTVQENQKKWTPEQITLAIEKNEFPEGTSKQFKNTVSLFKQYYDHVPTSTESMVNAFMYPNGTLNSNRIALNVAIVQSRDLDASKTLNDLRTSFTSKDTPAKRSPAASMAQLVQAGLVPTATANQFVDCVVALHSDKPSPSIVSYLGRVMNPENKFPTEVRNHTIATLAASLSKDDLEIFRRNANVSPEVLNNIPDRPSIMIGSTQAAQLLIHAGFLEQPKAPEIPQSRAATSALPPGYSAMPDEGEALPPTTPRHTLAQAGRTKTVFSPLMPVAKRMELALNPEATTRDRKLLTKALQDPQYRQEALELILKTAPESLSARHLQILNDIAQREITPEDCTQVAEFLCQLAITPNPLSALATNYIATIIANSQRYPLKMREAVVFKLIDNLDETALSAFRQKIDERTKLATAAKEFKSYQSLGKHKSDTGEEVDAYQVGGRIILRSSAEAKVVLGPLEKAFPNVKITAGMELPDIQPISTIFPGIRDHINQPRTTTSSLKASNTATQLLDQLIFYVPPLPKPPRGAKK